MLICLNSSMLNSSLIILISTMVVATQATQYQAAAPTPHHKFVGRSLSLINYGFFESRITTKHETLWNKKFLAKREAAPHSAPFIVSIQVRTANNELVHYCAGTIINENWILTAAHCLSSRRAVENSVIVAGCHDIHANEVECVQIRNIDYYHTHELYLGGTNPYDIALIHTSEPLEFGKYVQAAMLPEHEATPDADGGYGTLYGWGNVSMTTVPKYPHKLQEANMPILDMKLCEEILAASGLQLHETNLCTGPLSGGVSICTADSGGPLVQPCCEYFEEEAEEEAYTVIGIVSWGKKPCGQKNAPSVFVRVSAFTDWIEEIITGPTMLEESI